MDIRTIVHHLRQGVSGRQLVRDLSMNKGVPYCGKKSLEQSLHEHGELRAEMDD